MRSTSIVAEAIVAFLVVACGQPGAPAQPSGTAPASAGATAAATETATPQPPAPTPLNPAPAEMLGKWTAEFAQDDIAEITITPTGIKIVGFGGSDVRLEVTGDELALSHSQLCDGVGRYRWSIEGDKLRFDSIQPDPCDFRGKRFDGITYTRVPG